MIKSPFSSRQPKDFNFNALSKSTHERINASSNRYFTALLKEQDTLSIFLIAHIMKIFML